MSRVRLPLRRRINVWLHRWREFWARKYTGKGDKEIRKLSDDEIVYRVFDFIFQSRIRYDPAVYDHDCSSLNPSEAALWYLWDLDCEVRNGGYNQYFFNKPNRSVEPVIEAHDVVGASQHKALFIAAAADAGHVRPTHEQARAAGSGGIEHLLQAFSDSYRDNPLNDLDKAYYDLTPDIEDILRSYIRSHPDAFTHKRA